MDLEIYDQVFDFFDHQINGNYLLMNLKSEDKRQR